VVVGATVVVVVGTVVVVVGGSVVDGAWLVVAADGLLHAATRNTRARRRFTPGEATWHVWSDAPRLGMAGQVFGHGQVTDTTA
jgi:hypothetical protein